MKTSELIAAVAELPIEERAVVVDSLLKSLDPPDLSVDRAWLALAQYRLQELRDGKAETVAGEQVFQNLRTHLRK